MFKQRLLIAPDKCFLSLIKIGYSSAIRDARKSQLIQPEALDHNLACLYVEFKTFSQLLAFFK